MNEHDDGGPAYPVKFTGTADEYSGMSLWDAAALAALTGIIAQSPTAEPVETFVKEACNVADAFIKERRERESGNDDV